MERETFQERVEKVESRVEGRIDEVTSEYVQATITDEEGDLLAARLHHGQFLVRPKPGMTFTWTISTADVRGARRRISEVRLHPEVPLKVVP
jgi:hypothetical protein